MCQRKVPTPCGIYGLGLNVGPPARARTHTHAGSEHHHWPPAWSFLLQADSPRQKGDGETLNLLLGPCCFCTVKARTWVSHMAKQTSYHESYCTVVWFKHFFIPCQASSQELCSGVRPAQVSVCGCRVWLMWDSTPPRLSFFHHIYFRYTDTPHLVT